MEKVIEIVKQMVEDGQISQEIAEKYCPEIKKYKDEIIKKQILELIKQHSVNSDRCMMENWVCDHAPLQQFKPSDEQMEALESATANCAYSEYQDCLRELMAQLKKLKEE